MTGPCTVCRIPDSPAIQLGAEPLYLCAVCHARQEERFACAMLVEGFEVINREFDPDVQPVCDLLKILARAIRERGAK